MHEYMALQSEAPPSPEQLTELSKEGGWELVTFLYAPEPHGCIYTYLRREKPPA